MQETVQWQVYSSSLYVLANYHDTFIVQMRYLGDDLHEGDVILSNHPAAGGSHLPDLTVITPVSTAV